MSTQKSIFTSILPILCIVGICILALMWNRDTNPFKKNVIKIQGPQNSPFSK